MERIERALAELKREAPPQQAALGGEARETRREPETTAAGSR
jgi:hypothetical protein